MQKKPASSSSEILQYIRRSLLLKIPYPAVILILVLVIAHFLPLWDAVSPAKLDGSPTGKQIRDQDCVTKQLDVLYYSGYDYRRNGSIRGHYYYHLTDSRCDFYLIASGTDPIAPPELRQYTVTGRLESDAELRTDLIRLVAEDISWTEAGLRRITSNYMINEPVSYTHLLLLLSKNAPLPTPFGVPKLRCRVLAPDIFGAGPLD